MVVRAVRAGDIPREETHCKILLYGNAGSGKTTAVAKLDRCLIIETDAHASAIIRSTNPNAEVVEISSTAELREVLGLLKAARPAPHGGIRVRWPGIPWGRNEKVPSGADRRYRLQPRTADYRAVVLDHTTDWQRILTKEVIDRTAGKEIASLQDWQVIIGQTAQMCNDLRHLPCHVVLIFHAESVVVEDKRFVQPAIVGKRLPNQLSGFVGVVAYAFKRTGESAEEGKPGMSQYLGLTDGNERFLTKAHTALPPICKLDLQQWIDDMVDFRLDTPAVEVPPEQIPDADEEADKRSEPEVDEATGAESAPDEMQQSTPAALVGQKRDQVERPVQAPVPEPPGPARGEVPKASGSNTPEIDGETTVRRVTGGRRRRRRRTTSATR